MRKNAVLRRRPSPAQSHQLTPNSPAGNRGGEWTEAGEFYGLSFQFAVFSLRFAVWCGEVWCGVAWCGVVWCGVFGFRFGTHGLWRGGGDRVGTDFSR